MDPINPIIAKQLYGSNSRQNKNYGMISNVFSSMKNAFQPRAIYKEIDTRAFDMALAANQEVIDRLEQYVDNQKIELRVGANIPMKESE